MPFHLNGYSNFHDINLDYFLSEFKKIEDDVKAVEALVIDMEDIKEKYNEIVSLYEQLETDFEEFETAVNNNFYTLSARLEQQIVDDFAGLQAQIDSFKSEVNYTLDGFHDELNALNLKLDNAIENLADSFKMTNPFTGEDESITAVIYTLATFHMEDALTAAEYDGLELTASAYDSLGLTAYQYDVLGKQYLMP